MPGLEALPPELVLSILGHLPLQSLCCLTLTSKSWYNFIETNESVIYRQAAHLHKYIASPNETIAEAEEAFYRGRCEHSESWKAYCRRRLSTDRSWLGQGHAKARTYSTECPDVHRIKIDEAHGIVITTHYEGGISVFDAETDHLIWRLASTWVRPYAHCEYENGFLIFDRLGPMKEVWRLEAAEPQPPPKVSLPDEDQHEAYEDAKSLSKQYKKYSATNKGHFAPWALLSTPAFGRAYRFVYPTLAVASVDSVYLWDIPSARMIETIVNIQAQVDGVALGEINYIDVNSQYVFLCGSSGLRIFRRGGGTLALNMLSTRPLYGKTPVALEADEGEMHASEWRTLTANASPIRAFNWNGEPKRHAVPHEFMAVHVSPCGRHLAVLPSDNRILLIQDFDRVVKQPTLLTDVVLEVFLQSFALAGPAWQIHEHSIYLAFGHDRVSVVSTTGIFILTLDTREHLLLGEESYERRTLGVIQDRSRLDSAASFPYMSASYLRFASSGLHMIALGDVSCLQMTHTKLLFTWPLHEVPSVDEDDLEPEPDLEAENPELASVEKEGALLDQQDVTFVNQVPFSNMSPSGTNSGPAREPLPVLSTYDLDDDMYHEDDDYDYDGDDDEGYDAYEARWDGSDYEPDHDDETEMGPAVCCIDFAAYP